MPLPIQRKQVRLNILIPLEIRDRLIEASSSQGKRISVLVRESIEEKISRIERAIHDEKMREAYQGLAEENALISEEFRYADSENLS